MRKEMWFAFKAKWEYGKALWEYEDIVLDEFDTWKEFAEEIGASPSDISRAKKGFEYLMDQGADTWEEVKALLEQKQIKPTVKNFEGIGRLLNEPRPNEGYEDYTSRDQSRLEELAKEAEEILMRNENPNRNQPIEVDTSEDALSLVEYLTELREKLAKQDPYNVDWSSETYLNFIRGYGRDLLTGEPCERCEAHHTDPNNGTGAYGKKLPDWATIPVKTSTHDKINRGELIPTPEQILAAQVKCLATFIMTLK